MDTAQARVNIYATELAEFGERFPDWAVICENPIFFEFESDGRIVASSIPETDWLPGHDRLAADALQFGRTELFPVWLTEAQAKFMRQVLEAALETQVSYWLPAEQVELRDSGVFEDFLTQGTRNNALRSRTMIAMENCDDVNSMIGIITFRPQYFVIETQSTMRDERRFANIVDELEATIAKPHRPPFARPAITRRTASARGDAFLALQIYGLEGCVGDRLRQTIAGFGVGTTLLPGITREALKQALAGVEAAAAFDTLAVLGLPGLLPPPLRDIQRVRAMHVAASKITDQFGMHLQDLERIQARGSFFARIGNSLTRGKRDADIRETWSSRDYEKLCAVLGEASR